MVASAYEDLSKNPIAFKRSCTECELGRGKGVGSISPDDPSNLKLALFSDHPGVYEEEKGWPFVPSDLIKKVKTYRRIKRNAGKLVRDTIRDLGLCDRSHVFYSNVLKCNPVAKDIGLITIDEYKHLYICLKTWLVEEIRYIDSHKPELPIIVAGKWATKAFSHIYQIGIGETSKLRGKVHMLGTHPTIFTYNPALFAKGESYEETSLLADPRTGVLKVSSIQRLPPIVGSPMYFFNQDINLIRCYIN